MSGQYVREADQVLAFRLARCGLAARDARSLAEAAACPVSDFARDAALLALAARVEDVTRESYARAIESRELLLAHVVRGAIHALAPEDHGLYGRALIATDEDELRAQLGLRTATRDDLNEVAAAVKSALAGGRRLDKVALHEDMRRSVREELLPWCKSCKSHHVAPMLWRYATVVAGARLDAERRYLMGRPRRASGDDAVRRFLGFYGPAKPGDFADWAGVARSHAKRIWGELELTEVGDFGSLLPEDRDALASPPQAEGVRLVPPGDPYLQKPNRPLLAPDGALRKRLFRPVASPGIVLKDGRLVATWVPRAKGKKLEITVEKLGRLARKDIEDEASRIATLRGADLTLVLA